MEFEWDEAKSDACLAKRGFDFAFAAGVFADPTLLVEVDDRRDYGEPRLVLSGESRTFTSRSCLRRARPSCGSSPPAEPIERRSHAMGVVSVRLMPDGRIVRERDGVVETLVPRVDQARLAATTEVEIAAQEADDEAEARDAAAAYARRVRRRTGLTQSAFAARIGVALDTVRNWEQGKRAPAGPARALLRVIDRAPEAALAALE